MIRKIRVIAGPYRLARKYAQSRGWANDEFLIVTRAHQLASLDPKLIATIVTVRLHTLGRRVTEDIEQEIDRVCALWPVHRAAVAA